VTLSCIGDAVITTDTCGKVTYLNPVAEVITGWASTDANGRPLPEIFHIVRPGTNEIAPNPVEFVLRNKKPVGLTPHTLLMHGGDTHYPIEDSSAPILDQAGEIIGTVMCSTMSLARRRWQCR
jgi:PAS domain-containing protein